MTPERIALEPNYWVRRVLTDRYMMRIKYLPLVLLVAAGSWIR